MANETNETLENYLRARIYGADKPLEVELPKGVQEGLALGDFICRGVTELSGISTTRTEDFNLSSLPQGTNVEKHIIGYFESKGYEEIEVPHSMRNLHFKKENQRFDVNWTLLRDSGPCLITVLDESWRTK
jgi:hypothetical protein